MSTKRNNGKMKFPSIDIKGESNFGELEIKDTFSDIKIKKKISQEVSEIGKNKKRKCQSNKLM